MSVDRGIHISALLSARTKGAEVGRRNALLEAARMARRGEAIRCTFDRCDCGGPDDCKKRSALQPSEIADQIERLNKGDVRYDPPLTKATERARRLEVLLLRTVALIPQEEPYTTLRSEILLELEKTI